MENEIKLYDRTFRPYLSEAEVLEHIRQVAEAINRDYAGRTPLFLAVLNGSFMFASDLMKEIKTDANISFVKLASYAGTSSTGKVHELLGINEDIAGRDVIIVEDIIESGRTMRKMIDTLLSHNPSSVKVATLFFKPNKLEIEVPIDYVAFSIPDDFIVGYGLDYCQLGRNLRDVYQVNEK